VSFQGAGDGRAGARRRAEPAEWAGGGGGADRRAAAADLRRRARLARLEDEARGGPGGVFGVDAGAAEPWAAAEGRPRAQLGRLEDAAGDAQGRVVRGLAEAGGGLEGVPGLRAAPEAALQTARSA